jgi:hypothetical protein
VVGRLRFALELGKGLVYRAASITARAILSCTFTDKAFSCVLFDATRLLAVGFSYLMD